MLIEAEEVKAPSTPSPASTALIYASDYGHVSVVRSVIVRGADCNARDSGGRSPLFRATAHGYDDIAKVLLSAGCNMLLPDYEVSSLWMIDCSSQTRRETVLFTSPLTSVT